MVRVLRNRSMGLYRLYKLYGFGYGFADEEMILAIEFQSNGRIQTTPMIALRWSR